jgi:hypothetical protein
MFPSRNSSPAVILTGGRPTQGGRTEWQDPDDISLTMLHQGILTTLLIPQELCFELLMGELAKSKGFIAAAGVGQR